MDTAVGRFVVQWCNGPRGCMEGAGMDDGGSL
jgi:hypothetical protein